MKAIIFLFVMSALGFGQIVTTSAPNVAPWGAVTVSVDLMPNPAKPVGSFTARLSWDSEVLDFYFYTEGSFGIQKYNRTGEGELMFNGVNPQGVTKKTNIVKVTFWSNVGWGSTLASTEILACAQAGTFVSLTPVPCYPAMIKIGSFSWWNWRH